MDRQNDNCIIFSGHYRTFDKTKENLKKFIEINHQDVYCHLWDPTSDQVNEVKRYLEPIEIIVENYSEKEHSFIEAEERVKNKFLKQPNQDILRNQFSMHYARKRAYDLVKKDYENISIARYDLVVRPFLIPKDIAIMTPQEGAWGLISDIFVSAHKNLKEHIFIYDVLEDLHSTPFDDSFVNFLLHNFKYGEQNTAIHRYTRYCPHMAFLRNIFNKKLPWTVYNFPVILQSTIDRSR